MYITKAQLDARLEGQSKLELKKRPVGPKEGIKQLTHEEKVLVGLIAKHDTQANAAALVGTTQENVSYISRGLSGGKVLDKKLVEDIEAVDKTVKQKVADKALDLLMGALEQVEEKGSIVKNGVEATIVAKNIASIVDKMQPRELGQNAIGPRIQINIHGSKQKAESEYEVIEVPAVSA